METCSVLTHMCNLRSKQLSTCASIQKALKDGSLVNEMTKPKKTKSWTKSSGLVAMWWSDGCFFTFPSGTTRNRQDTQMNKSINLQKPLYTCLLGGGEEKPTTSTFLVLICSSFRAATCAAGGPPPPPQNVSATNLNTTQCYWSQPSALVAQFLLLAINWQLRKPLVRCEAANCSSLASRNNLL